MERTMKLSEDLGSNISTSFVASSPEHVKAIVMPGVDNLEKTLSEPPFILAETVSDFSINIDEFCID